MRATPRSASCTDETWVSDVGTVAFLLDHFLQAAHLPLDPPEPGERRRLEFRIHRHRVLAVAGTGAGAGGEAPVGRGVVAGCRGMHQALRRRKLLVTTETLLTAMAAAAIVGVRSSPNIG